ncbi:MAG: DEAD/DEAH box helicase [Proteobacteria bacterium]|nr:DEAD/DEAH box helicase [Pseudomonadota bacterium]
MTVDTFAALGLPAPLLLALADVGYETPSPIQAGCIPILIAGHDLLGEAQTGTGKTAAFALPILARLDLSKKAPQALVLVPTRELAIQVAEAFQRYATHVPGFHVLPVYGGQSLLPQLRQLSRGAHVIVGTPGRVMDHLERKSLSLESLSTLVLDEADEMLRMGFLEDVEWILEHTPATRQTALFSATLPPPIQRVARKHLRAPKEVRIRAATTTVAKVRQRYWLVRGTDKLDALTRMLEVEESLDATLIFVRTRTATAELAGKLEARGYAAAALSGDMAQPLRERVIEKLKSGALDIVVATDVAARGIDVARISHVINYDIPYDTEAYVHRIGRTGRAGRAGDAILFVAPREQRMLHAIEAATRQKIEPIGLPTREDVAGRRLAQFTAQVGEALAGLDEEQLAFFREVARGLQKSHDRGTSEVAAALAFMAQRDRPLQPDPADWAEQSKYEARPARADAPRPQREAPPKRERLGRPKPPEAAAPAARAERTERTERPPRAERPGPPPPMQVYRIDVGRAHGATARDVVGAIANEGGIEGRLIGAVRLEEESGTVELPEKLPYRLLEKLQSTRVRKRPLKLTLVGGASAPAREKRDAPAHDKRGGTGYPKREAGAYPKRDGTGTLRRDAPPYGKRDVSAGPKRDAPSHAKRGAPTDTKRGKWHRKP